MSEQEAYRVVRGSVRLPRGAQGTGFTMTRKDMVIQGELLPPGIFPETDIRSWLDEGRIELSGITVEVAKEAIAAQAANPFQVDPSTLVGKTMEELLIMVLEIAPDYDADELESEAAVVQLLTSGWQPHMRQTIAPVNDRSRPKALALDKLSQGLGGSSVRMGNRDLSQEAQAGLEAAKARAQATETEKE